MQDFTMTLVLVRLPQNSVGETDYDVLSVIENHYQRVGLTIVGRLKREFPNHKLTKELCSLLPKSRHKDARNILGAGTVVAVVLKYPMGTKGVEERQDNDLRELVRKRLFRPHGEFSTFFQEDADKHIDAWFRSGNATSTPSSAVS